MTASRDLPTDLDRLAAYMRELGLEPRSVGLCFGISHEVLLYLLKKDFVGFHRRLLRSSHHARQPIRPADADTREFFNEIIEINQPEYFTQKLQTQHQLSQKVGLAKTLPLHLPPELVRESPDDRQDCIHAPLRFSGTYTLEGLLTYFTSARRAVQTSGVSMGHPVPLILHSGTHVITVAFDCETARWVMVHTGNLVKKNIEDYYYATDGAIARAVHRAYGHSDNTIFSTTGFATKTQLKNMADIALAWQMDPVFQQLHTVPAERAILPDREGNTWLGVATLEGDAAMVSQLIIDGADVNRVNRFGFPALYTASHEGRADIVRLLVRAGANVNAFISTQGTTALLRAAAAGWDGVVQALLEAGADANLPDHTGMTPLQYSIYNRQKHCEALLRKHAERSALRQQSIFPAVQTNTFTSERILLRR